MTDAIAPNNTAVCDQYFNKCNATNRSESQMELKNNSAVNALCNELNTAEVDKVIDGNNTSKLNITQTSQISNIVIEKCVNKCNVTDDTFKAEQTKTKNNSDPVLKYINKKTDKAFSTNKTKGHIKNSVERRKRSLDIKTNVDNEIASPALVEFTTSHDNKEREELDLHPHKTGKIIKKTDLANFNIETLHEDSNAPTNSDSVNNETLSDLQYYQKNKDDNVSIEPQQRHKANDDYKNSTESTESESRESDTSSEDIYNNRNKSSQKQNQEDEIDSHTVHIPIKNESNEKYTDDKIISSIKQTSNEEDKSVENSNESNEFTTSKPRNEYEETAELIKPKYFRDEDFSYEKIPINDRSQNEPRKNSHENLNSDEVTQSKPTSSLAVDSDVSNKQNSSHVIDVPTLSKDDLIDPNDQPVNINDGEVKPVVELNIEDDKSESSEESSTEKQNGHLEKSEENDSSSEEEQTNNEEVNEKIILPKKHEGKDNVKQQFERIPLNYNHDKSQKETKSNDNAENTKSYRDTNINDGTLDALTPNIHKYDDNLNIKFDNIAIKLPEINLPDDILSYSHIEVPEEEKKNKDPKKYHYYDGDDSEENVKEQKKSITETPNNRDYYSIFDNDNDRDHDSYKISNKNNNEDEEEDLYEKFVRERFGKRGSFGKRSDKLQADEHKPSNPKLLETIQKILKKTETVHQEAAKSGDPNAGYMWTLEYGENL